MILVKILKRKDASSLIIAIIIASVLWQTLQTVSSDLAATISSVKGTEGFYGGPYSMPGSGWEHIYLYPILWGFLQIVFLEIIAWVAILGGAALRSSAKKK